MPTPISCPAFARALVSSGDLDPIYTMMQRGLLHEQRQVFSVAYWMFYHAGVAAHLTECYQKGDNFWKEATRLLHTPGVPRGTERRHFRGKNAHNAIQTLAERYETPELMAISIGALPVNTQFQHALTTVMAHVQTWPQFGPWIAFKVADMSDAVLEYETDFSASYEQWFEAPIQGAYMYVYPETWSAAYDRDQGARQEKQRASTCQLAQRQLALQLENDSSLEALMCPHNTRRTLGPQEYETIFCKYKSHLNGRYPVGKDTTEIRHHLAGWGTLAESLQDQLPGVGVPR